MIYLKLLRLTLLIVCMACAMPSDAQIWKRIKKRVEHKVENKANEKIDDLTDEVIDTALEAPQEEASTDPPGAQDPSPADPPINLSSDGLMAQVLKAQNATLPAQYDWDISIRYLISSDGEQSYLSYYLKNSGDHIAFRVNDKEDLILIDQKADVMVNYQDKKAKKTAQKLPNMMNAFSLEDDEQTLLSEEFSIEETGATKVIAGYTCQQYLSSSKEGSAEIWATSELDADFMNIFRQNFSKNKKTRGASQLMAKLMEKTALEIIYTDKKNRKKYSMHMTAVEIDKSPAPINNSDYEWIDSM